MARLIRFTALAVDAEHDGKEMDAQHAMECVAMRFKVFIEAFDLKFKKGDLQLLAIGEKAAHLDRPTKSRKPKKPAERKS